MSPYTESETYPRGRRVLLVPVAAAFLVGPYGLMLGGGPAGALPWALTALAIAFGALFAGAGIAQPRRSVTAGEQPGTITIVQTAPLPRIGVEREHRRFDAVTGMHIEEVGTKRTAAHGFRPVLEFGEIETLPLKRRAAEEQAQDVVDHLVLLGLPGISRAAQRAELAAAEPPTTWL